MKKKILLPLLLIILLLGVGSIIWYANQNQNIIEEKQQPKKEEVIKNDTQMVTKSNEEKTKEEKSSEVATLVEPSAQEESVRSNYRQIINQVTTPVRDVVETLNPIIEISNDVEVQPEVKKDPKLIKVTANKQESIAFTQDSIKVDILSHDIEDNSEVTVELVKSDETSFEPKQEVKGKLTNQFVNLELNLNDKIEQGNYLLKVSVARYSIVEKLSYKVNRKIVPTLKSLSLDKTQSIEKTATEVEVNLNTKDIENAETIILELLNSNNEVQVKKEVQVQDNTAKAKIEIADTLEFGKYTIRATYKTLQLEKEYEVLYLPVPEILESKINKNIISYGYKENIKIELKLKDIEENSDMKISLLNATKQPVEGYEVQSSKTGKDVFNYTFELNPLNPDKYFIRVAYNENVFTDIDLTVSDATNNWNDLLDYSKKNDELYWFDELNRAYPYKDASSPFDPKKPTIIFVHGWQDGGVKKNYSPDFNYVIEYDTKEGNKTVKKQVKFNTVKAWIDAGYNVGVYNWVQIADEAGDGWTGLIPYSAEAKIWTTNYQYYKIPMRYRLNNGTFINEPNKTAADLFVEKYLDAMKDYQGDHITLAGHSLGNQMVLRATSMILNQVENNKAEKSIVPDRLTLLDPYYSGNTDVFKNQTKTNTELAAIIAKELAGKNIVIDMFKSSMLTTSSFTGNTNRALENIAAYHRINPDLLGVTAQHSAAYQLYFWAKYFNNSLYIKSDAEIASLMGSNFKVEQIDGKTSITPEDDTSKITTSGTYVPVENIVLKDNKNNVLTQTDKENADTVEVQVGEYIQIDTEVFPLTASSKVVVIEEVEGDLDSVQVAYDGYIKGIKQGSALLKAVVVKRDAKGTVTGKIEKYFRVVVK